MRRGASEVGVACWWWLAPERSFGVGRVKTRRRLDLISPFWGSGVRRCRDGETNVCRKARTLAREAGLALIARCLFLRLRLACKKALGRLCGFGRRGLFCW